MNLLTKLVEHVPIPQMYRIRQRFDDSALEDPMRTLREKLNQDGLFQNVSPGAQIAITVGSRGIANLAPLVKEIVDAVKHAGAQPFIVPSMGSHGGATAEGQTEVLRHLGISEQTMGAPIRSTMNVHQIGQLDNGLPVYVDEYAYAADGIIVVNRVKPHTAFRGKIESGIMKMISIGMGNQKGAEACHQMGFKYMAENVPAMAKMIMQHVPLLFGVALVENAYDETCRVEVILPDQLEEKETELQMEAKQRMPQLLFPHIDVLVIDYIGKNISGDGMDPNVTGRYPTPYAHGGPEVEKMVVLDLTEESQGNANGVGTSDFTTQRLVDKADWIATYANGLTSTVVAPTKTATTMPNDRDAIKAAIKTCNVLDFSTATVVRIKDTLHLGEIEISDTLLEEAKQHPQIEIVEGPYDLQFDEDGYLYRQH